MKLHYMIAIILPKCWILGKSNDTARVRYVIGHMADSCLMVQTLVTLYTKQADAATWNLPHEVFPVFSKKLTSGACCIYPLIDHRSAHHRTLQLGRSPCLGQTVMDQSLEARVACPHPHSFGAAESFAAASEAAH